MNNVGKIFIVLIAVVCVLFMAFSLVVFNSQINWKTKHDTVQAELAESKKTLEGKKREVENLVDAIKVEQKRQQDAEASYNTKVAELAEERDDFKAQFEKLENERKDAIDAVKRAHTTLAESRAELSELRKDHRKVQEDWGKLFTVYVEKTDEAHDLSRKLATARSVGEKLYKDYRDAIDVLRKFDLKPLPDLYSGIPPKGVEGIVTEVRPDGWVEISIGADSGLAKGQQLDVVRMSRGNPTLIGKVEVREVEPNKAACQILPAFRKGTVQRDDIVTYIDISN